MHEYHRFRRHPGRVEQFLLIGEGVAEDHRRGGEISEDEFVALLGDRGRRGDVDNERNAFLLGDLRDRRGLAGIEGADQKLGAVVDQLLGPRPRNLHVGLSVGVHDRELGQDELLEDRGRELDPALAILPDACLRSRARQQNADLQRPTLGASEVERRGRSKQSGGARAGGEAASGDGLGWRRAGHLRSSQMCFSAVACDFSYRLRSKMQWAMTARSAKRSRTTND